MAYKEVKVIKNNPTLKGMAVMIPDVVFSTGQGVDLKMQIVKPWADESAKEQPRYPLIVFVQGSAWTFPDVYYELPQLAQFAREGYVVATLTHRNCLDGHPFPAYLEDIKTGIRFLRKNADTYQIDPKRVGIWGTSSGGNTALLVGLTGDEKRYKTEEYPEFSDSVKMAVDCFGPTDLSDVIENIPQMDEDTKALFAALRGEDTKENLEKLLEMNPVNHIKEGITYPPFLILQGNQDTVVDYSQSELIYHRLSDAGADATLICVDGAPHEGSFWGNELLDIIKDFINRNL
ncbi:alpha/beta hydrolase [Anaerocolumna xylanovorans]|uniref:Acetyl esterase/lipase n=1 Tax=Anaerocolumna xylanovorans DSM 12503 TaxID=1121345 RepID=A0A1M7XWQ0_9FIRM|nr:alpha/beta hydrolase [Anaerocolumna xylanovorans]SHO43210.1 Acetyl esterase/lipase [Anaerocolumna xylanovorans DSM 12503]